VESPGPTLIRAGPVTVFIRNPDGTFATFDSPPTRPPSQPTCPNPRASIQPAWSPDSIWTRVSAARIGQMFSNVADTMASYEWQTGRLPFRCPVNPSLSNREPNPTSINSAGEIVGYYWTGDQSSSDSLFLRQPDGTIFTFDPPNETPSHRRGSSASTARRKRRQLSDKTTRVLEGFLAGAGRHFLQTSLHRAQVPRYRP